MNLSLSSFLVTSTCRAVRVEYDPDLAKNNNYNLLFKTLDPSIQKDDLVVVPTTTRHGFTVVKVLETDMTINYDTQTEYKFVVGKVDSTAYESLLAEDKALIAKVGKIEENKKKRELMEAMGLDASAIGDTYANVAIAAPSTPQQAGTKAPLQPAEPFIQP